MSDIILPARTLEDLLRDLICLNEAIANLRAAYELLQRHPKGDA